MSHGARKKNASPSADGGAGLLTASASATASPGVGNSRTNKLRIDTDLDPRSPPRTPRTDSKGETREAPTLTLEKCLAKLQKIPKGAITIGPVVGKGRFKRVHQGQFRGTDVVLLRYAKDASRGFSPSKSGGPESPAAAEQRDRNLNELRILVITAREANPAVPEIYGVSHEPHATVIVQEFARFGTLKEALQRSDVVDNCTNLHKLHFAAQVARAMVFLQSECVVHADLSCRNVLVFRFDPQDPRSGVAKVSDFGLSVLLNQDETSILLKQPQATRWCAPETVGRTELSFASDAWSIGVTVWEMYASDGANPWPKREKRADVAARLRDLAETGGEAEGGSDVSGDFPRDSGCPEVVHRAILKSLEADVSKRPCAAEMAETFEQILAGGGEVDARDIPPPVETLETTFAAPPEEAEPSTRGLDVAEECQQTQKMEREWRVDAQPRDWLLSQASLSAALSDANQTGFARRKVQETFSDSDRQLLLEVEEELGRTKAPGSERQERLGLSKLVASARQEQIGSSRFLPSGRQVQRIQSCEEKRVVRDMLPDERLNGHSSVAASWTWPSPNASSRQVLTNSHRISNQSPTRREPWLTPPSGEFHDALVGSHVPSFKPFVYPPGAEKVAHGHAVGEHTWSPPSTSWALWSMSRRGPRRQAFMSKAEGMAAFEAQRKIGPCMLRDPCGAEVAAHGWTTSYASGSSPPGVQHGFSTAPSSPTWPDSARGHLRAKSASPVPLARSQKVLRFLPAFSVPTVPVPPAPLVQFPRAPAGQTPVSPIAMPSFVTPPAPLLSPGNAWRRHCPTVTAPAFTPPYPSSQYAGYVRAQSVPRKAAFSPPCHVEADMMQSIRSNGLSFPACGGG